MLKPGSRHWSVVVVARWNRAILTPLGITRRLFALPEGTEMKVAVPMDAPGPLKVTHGDLTVGIDNDRLTIETHAPDYQGLGRAMEIGRRALEDLPQTPVLAAGFNVYLVAEPEFKPFVDLFDADWDARISKAGYQIANHAAGRGIAWNEGEIGVQIARSGSGEFEVILNFHKTSGDVPVLKKWLGTSTSEVEEQVVRIVGTLQEEGKP